MSVLLTLLLQYAICNMQYAYAMISMNAFCQKLQSMLITWDRFQIQAAPCPLVEASPQMPPAQAPSVSVTRKVVLTVTVTVTVNENPAAQ